MDTENDTPETVVISVDGSDPVPMVSVDAVESVVAETGENTGGESEAVELARIEADTTVTVAAINADVETARIEADAERDTKWHEEKQELQASITELKLQVENLTAKLSSEGASQSTPTPEPLETELEIETPPEPNLTPEFTPELTSETETELGADAGAESAEVVAVAVAVPARKRRRLI